MGSIGRVDSVQHQTMHAKSGIGSNRPLRVLGRTIRIMVAS